MNRIQLYNYKHFIEVINRVNNLDNNKLKPKKKTLNINLTICIKLDIIQNKKSHCINLRVS